MKSFYLIVFILISCKSDYSKYNKSRFYANEFIVQQIENEDAYKLYDEGVELFSKGEIKPAIKKLENSFEIEKSPITLYELGVIAMETENFKVALKKFQESIELDSFYWPSYIGKTKLLIKLKDFKNAEISLNSLKQYTDLEFVHAYADFHFAVLYFNKDNDCQKAKEYIKKASSLESYERLGFQYFLIKDQIDKNCD